MPLPDDAAPADQVAVDRLLLREWNRLMYAHRGDEVLSDYTISDFIKLGNKIALSLERYLVENPRRDSQGHGK